MRVVCNKCQNDCEQDSEYYYCPSCRACFEIYLTIDVEREGYADLAKENKRLIKENNELLEDNKELLYELKNLQELQL